jgi:hypothetical protein
MSPINDETNPRLALQRSTFFQQLDSEPAVKRLFIQASLSEGGQKGLQANFEQMMNYGNARNFTHASQIIHSGFYGPVNRGEAQHKILSKVTIELAEEALQKVRNGSNLLDYRTDQGMPGDPNFRKEQNSHYRPKEISGGFFADHPMFEKSDGTVSWAQRQKDADIKYAADHPVAKEEENDTASAVLPESEAGEETS